MRKIAIKMAGLVLYMAAGFVLLFWKLERGGLHNAELLLPLAWLAGAVALGFRLDKACKQAGRWGEAAHHFFSARYRFYEAGPGHLYPLRCAGGGVRSGLCCLRCAGGGRSPPE